MAERIPAITIWQPWASLIAEGAKPYEWRGWPAPERFVGKRIAIHAGARRMKKTEIADLIYCLEHEGSAGTSLVPEIALPLLHRWQMSLDLPLSSVVCIATLRRPITASTYAAEHGYSARDSDRIDHAKWGWPLTEIERLVPFVPARGAQGFWWWQGANA